jgi:hypothetical protein
MRADFGLALMLTFPILAGGCSGSKATTAPRAPESFLVAFAVDVECASAGFQQVQLTLDGTVLRQESFPPMSMYLNSVAVPGIAPGSHLAGFRVTQQTSSPATGCAISGNWGAQLSLMNSQSGDFPSTTNQSIATNQTVTFPFTIAP